MQLFCVFFQREKDLNKFSRKKVHRSVHSQLKKGLTHQQVFDKLAGEFGFRGASDMHALQKLAGWIEQIPGMSSLKRERGRRSLLIVLLVLLSVAEAWSALPVITLFGIHELPSRYLFMVLTVLMVYPLIYLILAVLSMGKSMKLYRWIIALMALAFLKDLPAFGLYFHAERWLFGLTMVVKLISVGLAWLIYRRLRSDASVEIDLSENVAESGDASISVSEK